MYKDYITCSRPLPEWEHETPPVVLGQLNQPAKPGWVHWFFSFDHNLGLTPEKRQKIINSVPKGSKLYKNKIQGLRGRATGLVFDLQPKNMITLDELNAKMGDEKKPLRFDIFTAGLDTAYSQQPQDTFVALLPAES